MRKGIYVGAGRWRRLVRTAASPPWFDRPGEELRDACALRRLDEADIRPLIEAGLRDPDVDVAGHARTAADELRVFPGWVFAET